MSNNIKTDFLPNLKKTTIIDAIKSFDKWLIDNKIDREKYILRYINNNSIRAELRANHVNTLAVLGIVAVDKLLKEKKFELTSQYKVHQGVSFLRLTLEVNDDNQYIK